MGVLRRIFWAPDTFSDVRTLVFRQTGHFAKSRFARTDRKTFMTAAMKIRWRAARFHTLGYLPWKPDPRPSTRPRDFFHETHQTSRSQAFLWLLAAKGRGQRGCRHNQHAAQVQTSTAAADRAEKVGRATKGGGSRTRLRAYRRRAATSATEGAATFLSNEFGSPPF